MMKYKKEYLKNNITSKPLISRTGLTNGLNGFTTAQKEKGSNFLFSSKQRKWLQLSVLSVATLLLLVASLQSSLILPKNNSNDKASFLSEENNNIKIGTRNTITIDGDASDWTGTLPTQIHSTAISNGEWLYKGEASDERTDLSESSNNDIVEARITADSTYLYFLIKMRDITNINLVHVSISIDVDHAQNDDKMNWLGAETGIVHSQQSNYGERNIDIHCSVADTPVIEMYADDGSSWYAPPTSPQVAINDTNDIVEARIARNDLMNPSEIWVAISTEKNIVGWNNNIDTTEDMGTCDGVDVVGGTSGSSDNAWGRDFSDGDVDNVYRISLGSDNVIPEFEEIVIPVLATSLIAFFVFRRKK